MGTVIRALENGLTRAAAAVWPLVEKANEAFPGRPFQPPWAPAPLPKSKERSKPPLGWPRTTDSLCPQCVKEARRAILSGEKDVDHLIHGKPGEIKAHIVEEDGQVLMRKTCPEHGAIEDLMSTDARFLERIERLFPGRDVKGAWTKLRQHGSSTIQYGRGAVLTVDLTNRCNMMCDPCFMDANQVGYVHELTLDDVKEILDNSMSIRPRRQLSVQFSGGEPTISPIFLEAVRYAKEVGYFCVQAATNGIRFAQEPEFARQAKDAGLRLAYLQFDGIGEEANSHRKVGNLFDVKLRAIENLAAADIDVVLVVSVVNGVNDDQVGRVIRFAIDNADKVTVVSFQPVSFTGRDEDISDEDRKRQRYTLTHLAHDVKDQTGLLEPLRDWFPLSAMAPFSALTDRINGMESQMGTLSCGCHPNCGIGTILFVHKHTGETVPLTRFLDLEQLMKDVDTIADGNRGKALTVAQVGLALLKNFKPEEAPAGLDFVTLVRQFLSQTGVTNFGDKADAHAFEWRALFVAGMWFQDLFNYDFRRTEMCIIPYGTQKGEISFCAYNTGAGWRQIIENMHMTATTRDWYKQHGKHKVYANQRAIVPLDASAAPLSVKVNETDAATRGPLAGQGKPRLPLAGGHGAGTAAGGGGCGTGCSCG